MRLDPDWNCLLELSWEQTERTWNATVFSRMLETPHIFLPSVVNFLLLLNKVAARVTLKGEISFLLAASSQAGYFQGSVIILYGVLEISPIGRGIAANKK